MNTYDEKPSALLPFHSPILGETVEFVIFTNSQNPLWKYTEAENHKALLELLKSIKMTYTLRAHGKHFEDDKDIRYIYDIAINRNGKAISFEFGSSIRDTELFTKQSASANTEEAFGFGNGLHKRTEEKKEFFRGFLYSVLSCIASDYHAYVGSFEDFCSEFGYDEDSRKAEKTYFAVQKQAFLLRKIFSADEIAMFPN